MGSDHYTKIRELGGTNGAFLAVDKHDATNMVVIKRLSDGTSGMEELNVALRVQHEHIIKFIESFAHDGSLYVVMKYEAGGDMESFLKRLQRQQKAPTTRTFLQWCVQLLRALQFCHENKVIHRDIKPGNIFLSEDTRSLYLGDFGSAKALQTASCMTSTFIGTPMWISPEVLQGMPYTYSSDVWSLGCVLYEMAVLRKPFTSSSFAALVQEVTKGDVTSLPSSVPPNVQAIIHGMLRVQPSERIGVAEALRLAVGALDELPPAAGSLQESGAGAAAAAIPARKAAKVAGVPAAKGNPSPPTTSLTASTTTTSCDGGSASQGPARRRSVMKTAPPPQNTSKRAREAAAALFQRRGAGAGPPALPRATGGGAPAAPSRRRSAAARGPAAPAVNGRRPTAEPAPRGSPAGSSDITEPRPSEWLRDRSNDLSVIEQYLHKFREYDEEVLHSDGRRPSMFYAAFAGCGRREGSRSSGTSEQQRPGADDRRAGSGGSRRVRPSQGRAPVHGRHSASPDPRQVKSNSPQRVRTSVDVPCDNNGALRRQAVAHANRPRPSPAPFCRQASSRSALEVKGIIQGTIQLHHQPRQASHARCPPERTAEEVRQSEEERRVMREKREQERLQMKLLIKEQRAKAMKGRRAKKMDAEVQIVLPDKLQYTANGVTPLE